MWGRTIAAVVATFSESTVGSSEIRTAASAAARFSIVGATGAAEDANSCKDAMDRN